MKKDNSKDNKSLEEIKRLNSLAFFKDSNFLYLYKKTERICMAIYMVTNFMSPEEAIKWKLRNTVTDLLETIISINSASLFSKDKTFRDISGKLFQTISFFKIAYHAGFVSSMNYDIIDSELNNLAKYLNEYDSNQLSAQTKLFADDYFTRDVPEFQDDNIKDIFYKRQSEAGIGQIENQKGQESAPRQNHNQNANYKRQTSSKNTDSKKTKTANSPTNTDRREKIINIIRQKDTVSVKDIAIEISDVSEKTIQRELLAMVDEGILEKEGERRWSRYSLK